MENLTFLNVNFYKLLSYTLSLKNKFDYCKKMIAICKNYET